MKTRLLITALLLAGLIANAQYSQQQLNDLLMAARVAYTAATSAPPSGYVYPTNGQSLFGIYAVDRSSAGNDGLCLTQTVYVTDGATGGAVYVSGRYDGVRYPQNVMAGRTQFLMCGWFKPSAANKTITITWNQNDSARGPCGYYADGNFYISPWFTGSEYAYVNYPHSNWLHWAVRFNGAGAGNEDKIQLQLGLTNMSLVFGGTLPGLIPDVEQTFSIGADVRASGDTVEGTFRDIVFMADIDLSAATQHFAATRPTSYDPNWHTNAAFSSAFLILDNLWSTNQP